MVAQLLLAYVSTNETSNQFPVVVNTTLYIYEKAYYFLHSHGCTKTITVFHILDNCTVFGDQ